MFIFTNLFFNHITAFTIQHNEDIKEYTDFSSFLNAFKVIPIASVKESYFVTLDQDVTLSVNDFPLDPSLTYNDHTTYSLFIQGINPQIKLQLNIQGSPQDRFQYVSFQNIDILIEGNSLTTKYIMFGENCTISTKDLITLYATDVTIDWSNLENFQQISFVRFSLLYLKPTSFPNHLPIMVQRMELYEANAIRLGIFIDATISFSRLQLLLHTNGQSIPISIPSYNYTVSFSFLLEPETSFTLSGNYAYSDSFPHYLFVRPSTNCQVTLNEGNYMTSEFSYYQESGLLTLNNPILFNNLTIAGNAKFAPKSYVNVNYFDYFSEQSVEGDLFLFCHEFRATPSVPFNCTEGNSLTITTQTFAVSSSLNIQGTLTVSESIYLYLPAETTINHLILENIPKISLEGDFSIPLEDPISPPIHSNSLSGSAKLMVSHQIATFQNQHKDQFYPFISTDGDFNLAQFSLYYDPNDEEQGFTPETSCLSLHRSGDTIGLLQTADYENSLTSICFGNEVLCKNEAYSTYINDITDWPLQINSFTSTVELIIYQSCTLDLSLQLNRDINFIIDIRSEIGGSTTAVIMNMRQDFADRIGELTLEVDGELTLRQAVELKGKVMIYPTSSDAIKNKENFHFTSTTTFYINSFLMLGSFPSYTECKYVIIYHEKITSFNFLDYGWIVITDEGEYSINYISVSNVYIFPDGSQNEISFHCSTNSPLPIQILIGENSVYNMYDFPSSFFPFIITSNCEIKINNQNLPIDFRQDLNPLYDSNEEELTVNSITGQTINNVNIHSPIRINSDIKIKSTTIKTLIFNDQVNLTNASIRLEGIQSRFSLPISLSGNAYMDYDVDQINLDPSASLHFLNGNDDVSCNKISTVVSFTDGKFTLPQVFVDDKVSVSTLSLIFDQSHVQENLGQLSSSLGYSSISDFADQLKRDTFLLYLTRNTYEEMRDQITVDGVDRVVFQDKVIRFQLNSATAIQLLDKEYDTFSNFGEIKKSQLIGYNCVYLSVLEISDRTRKEKDGSSKEKDVEIEYPALILGNYDINVAYLGGSQLYNVKPMYSIMKNLRMGLGHIIPAPQLQHTALWLGESDANDNILGSVIAYGEYYPHDGDLTFLAKDGARSYVASLKEFKEIFSAFPVKKLIVNKNLTMNDFLQKASLSGKWRAKHYNWATNNCQHFTAKCISILNATRAQKFDDDWTDVIPTVLNSLKSNELKGQMEYKKPSRNDLLFAVIAAIQ